MTSASNDAATRDPGGKIRAEIRAHGPMPFVRFMELALYCPQSGYYERIENTPGRRGDFYTSVSVGGLFGELLAARFAAWFHSAGIPSPVIVEAGAQDGRLAQDILMALQANDPDLFARIRYRVVEPSAAARGWQERRLEPYRPRVDWVEEIGELAREPVDGVAFANELLDAMPCHRLIWDRRQGCWKESAVREDGDRFAWDRIDLTPAAASAVPRVPEELLAALPDGFCTEVSPAGLEWMQAAAQVLRCGRLVLLDYGLTGAERWAPHRSAGTLRAYSAHRVGTGVLDEPGTHDLTAHADFAALQEAGEDAGLVTEGLWRQEQFLTTILADVEVARLAAGRWSPVRRRQFQTLVHPQHLGRVFRVLVQSRLASRAGTLPSL